MGKPVGRDDRVAVAPVRHPVAEVRTERIVHIAHDATLGIGPGGGATRAGRIDLDDRAHAS